MAYKDERRCDARAFEEQGEFFRGGQRGGAMGRGVAVPSEARAVIADNGCELCYAVLHEDQLIELAAIPASRTTAGLPLPRTSDMQLAAGDIDHASRWWVSRYHVVV